MTRHDIPWLSAAETAIAIKTKQVSPVEVVQAYLARIERLDGQLHAYITVLRDEALAAARQAEQTVLRGGGQGPVLDEGHSDHQWLARLSRLCAACRRHGDHAPTTGWQHSVGEAQPE